MNIGFEDGYDEGAGDIYEGIEGEGEGEGEYGEEEGEEGVEGENPFE